MMMMMMMIIIIIIIIIIIEHTKTNQALNGRVELAAKLIELSGFLK